VRAAQGIIFDVDGVILESESLHREAYNKSFEEFGVSYRWSPEYYDELQNKVGGGKPKMKYYFGEYGWPESKLGSSPTTEEEKTALVDKLQDRKTEIYKEFITGEVGKLRPGVARLMDEVLAAKKKGDLRLGICSASTKSSCLFVLDNLVGQERLQYFDVILAGDDVERKKPDPQIYKEALRRFPESVDPSKCVVIEDSLIGLQAAKAAGMKCVVTHTSSTANQDFGAADLVVSELGDEPTVQVDLEALLQLVR